MADSFPPSLAEKWALSGIRLIADTPRSHVYRATYALGGTVVAKLLKPSGLDESQGFDYLAWRGGVGAVRILARSETACLLEDAGGYTLTAYLRDHGDMAAASIIADVVVALHSPLSAPPPARLTPLDSLIEGLVEVAKNHLVDQERWLLAAASEVARGLLSSQTEVRPLHGDIHHDNILSTDGKAWRAIDPKGYLGDPVYEVANVFGNPLDSVTLILDPERIDRLSSDFAPLFGCTSDRVLGWAVVHAALSICWSLPGRSDPAEETNLQERLAFITIGLDLLSR